MNIIMLEWKDHVISRNIQVSVTISYCLENKNAKEHKNANISIDTRLEGQNAISTSLEICEITVQLQIWTEIQFYGCI